MQVAQFCHKNLFSLAYMPQTEQLFGEGLKWIDVTNPTLAEIEVLTSTYQLNRHIVEDCLQPEHLPKYEFVDDINFMILRYYACNEDCMITNIQELTNKIAIFYNDSFVVT